MLNGNLFIGGNIMTAQGWYTFFYINVIHTTAALRHPLFFKVLVLLIVLTFFFDRKKEPRGARAEGISCAWGPRDSNIQFNFSLPFRRIVPAERHKVYFCS